MICHRSLTSYTSTRHCEKEECYLWVKEISGVIQKALANKPKGKVMIGKAKNDNT